MFGPDGRVGVRIVELALVLEGKILVVGGEIGFGVLAAEGELANVRQVRFAGIGERRRGLRRVALPRCVRERAGTTNAAANASAAKQISGRPRFRSGMFPFGDRIGDRVRRCAIG